MKWALFTLPVPSLWMCRAQCLVSIFQTAGSRRQAVGGSSFFGLSVAHTQMETSWPLTEVIFKLHIFRFVFLAGGFETEHSRWKNVTCKSVVSVEIWTSLLFFFSLKWIRISWYAFYSLVRLPPLPIFKLRGLAVRNKLLLVNILANVQYFLGKSEQSFFWSFAYCFRRKSDCSLAGFDEM